MHPDPARRTSLLAIGLLAAGQLGAQTCRPVLDLNRAPTEISSSPAGSVRCGDLRLFAATTRDAGRELWKTDGTVAGTVLVKDIQPGPGGSSPTGLVCCNGVVYFAASDGKRGVELWRSDGTAAGTLLVKDIDPGPGASAPGVLACAHGRVFFSASTAATGAEPWVSDGTAAGTIRLGDVRPGTSSSGSRGFVAGPGNKIIFQANDGTHGHEPWITDGTVAGTAMLADIHVGSSNGIAQTTFFPSSFVVHAGKVLFPADDGTRGRELWETDGTPGGTKLLADIKTLPASGSVPVLFGSAVIGKDLYFVADDGTSQGSGREVWKTDGTAAGTVLAADVFPGWRGSDPGRLYAHGSTLYFVARGAFANGWEPWKLAAGRAALLKDINVGNGNSWPGWWHDIGDKVWFAATASGNDREAWITDGTPTGTVRVRDINPGAKPSNPAWPIAAPGGRRLLFAASGGGNDRELWTTDGTEAGTRLLVDIEPGRATASALADDSDPVCCWGNTLYFHADDGTGRGRELWSSDGTAGGTKFLLDIDPGAASSTPRGFTSCWTGGDKALVFFHASDATRGRELWVTDNTPAGTVLVKDIRPGPAGGVPPRAEMVSCNGKLIFGADDGRNGPELWVSDGTAAGTFMLADIRVGAGGSFPAYLTRCKGAVYFRADDGVRGPELWRTDGTAAGTFMVKDIYAGARGSRPAFMTCSGASVYLMADDGIRGAELWVSDGTAAGTMLVKDIRPGSAGGFPQRMVRCDDGTLYFTADDGATGWELWKSDGTAAGTSLVKDVVPGPGGVNPAQTVCCGRQVFFTPYRANGALYRSDGTAAGTFLVRQFDGFPHAFECVGDRLYFWGRNSAHGGELWVSDGTPAGTRVACDIVPGGGSGNPTDMVRCGGALYFSATTLMLGRELFRLDDPGAMVELLGQEGCGPAFPTLRASAPVIGKTMRFTGAGAPAEHLGALFLGMPTALPFRVPGIMKPRCRMDLSLQGMAPIGPLQTATSWSFDLPLPNQPGFRGATLRAQTVYLPASTVFPLCSSNGVALTLGDG